MSSATLSAVLMGALCVFAAITGYRDSIVKGCTVHGHIIVSGQRFACSPIVDRKR